MALCFTQEGTAISATDSANRETSFYVLPVSLNRRGVSLHVLPLSSQDGYRPVSLTGFNKLEELTNSRIQKPYRTLMAIPSGNPCSRLEARIETRKDNCERLFFLRSGYLRRSAFQGIDGIGA